MKLKENSLLSVLLIVLGASILLFGVYPFYVAIGVLGIAVAAFGLLDICEKQWIPGAIKILVGIAFVIIVCHAADILLYVLAGFLILYGLYQIYLAIKDGKKDVLGWIMALIIPVLCVTAGILLFFVSQTVWTIFAIILLVAAAVMIAEEYLLAK